MAESPRSESDSWTITSGVGFTALLVAAGRAVESDRPDALAHDPYARVLVEASGDDRAAALINSPASSNSPMGASRHLGVRTRFFDQFVLQAVGEGTRQVVVLAAGLDARAYRLEVPADTVFYELDQPAVLDFKARALAEAGAHAVARRTAVAVDLREDWPAALMSAGFDESAPTAWLVEGLLPYLPARAQATLFEQIARRSAAGSAVAVEGQIGKLDLKDFRAVAERYSRPGNPLGDFDVTKLFVADADREDPAEYLASQGWLVERAGNPAQLAAEYGVADGAFPPDAQQLTQRIGYFTARRPR